MPSYPPSVGIFAKAYYNTGTFSTPTWTEISLIRDVTLTDESDAADATTRGESGKEYLVGLTDRKAEFKMRREPSNVAYRALRKAHAEKSSVDLLFCSGSVTSKNNEGYRGPFYITQFASEEPMADVQMTNVVAVPAVPASGETAVIPIAIFAKATTSGSALSVGDDLYYDSANDQVTTTAGSNEYLGQAAIAASDSDAVVAIDITPTAP